MLTQIDQLRAVMDGLLMIAEIDAGAPEKFVPCDLAALAEDRAAEIAPLAIKGGRTVVVEAGNSDTVMTCPQACRARARRAAGERRPAHAVRHDDHHHGQGDKGGRLR